MNKSVFFDLDGTLTDPKIGITRSIQYALQKLGMDSPDLDELTWCIGPPLQHSFESLAGEKNVDQAIKYYRERFADVGWQENKVYPGVPAMLKTLNELKLPLYVATSKPHIYARKIIDHFDLSQYFVELYGSELDGTRTDKADLLKYALTESGVPKNSTMIGDRKHDVIGALRNDLQAIGVSYGYGSLTELRNAGAQDIVHQPDELLPLLSCKLA